MSILKVKVESSRKNFHNNYTLYLIDELTIKYTIQMYKGVPVGTSFSINTDYHQINEDNFITVNQKFENNQPQWLEVEILEIKKVNNGHLMLIKELATGEVLHHKLGNDIEDLIEGKVMEIEFKKEKIVTTSSYYKRYKIENWIFYENDFF